MSGQRFTPEEDAALLRMHSEGARYAEIAQVIGRNPHAVASRANVLLLPSRYRPWTNRDLVILRQNYARLGPTRVAEMLGRTVGATALRAGKEGLVYARRQWEPGELQRVRATVEALAVSLDRSVQEVARKATEMAREARRRG